MSMQKAHAVTGAFGFSGSYIAQRLLAAGQRVITLTNSPDRPNDFAGKVQARPYNFDAVQAMARSLEDVDVLYNTYWVRFNHTEFSHSTAVANTLALFKAAKIAGVTRIVHVSITNADANSPLEYFKGKGELENALKGSGLSYAIVRPAVLFGEKGILINNIAWVLRSFPLFATFGDGRTYHVQPIYVDDLAALMVEQGASRENCIINALGPEDYSYRELVSMIGKAIGKERPIMSLPPSIGYWISWFIGKMLGDEFVTQEEIAGLMADTLHVAGAEPTGTTLLSEWVRTHASSLGKEYQSELQRRQDRTIAY